MIFEILMAMTGKTAFWDVTTCNLEDA